MPGEFGYTPPPEASENSAPVASTTVEMGLAPAPVAETAGDENQEQAEVLATPEQRIAENYRVAILMVRSLDGYLPTQSKGPDAQGAAILATAIRKELGNHSEISDQEKQEIVERYITACKMARELANTLPTQGRGADYLSSSILAAEIAEELRVK